MLTLIVYCIVRHLLYTTTYTRSDWSAKDNNSVNTDRALLFAPLRNTTYTYSDWLPEA